MQTKIIERYFFFGLLLLTLVFSLFIFRPFWSVLALGISFSIVFYPIYNWLNSLRLPPSLSSLITVFIFAILVCGPLLGIGFIIFNQSQDAYHLMLNSEGTGPFISSLNKTINNVLPQGVTFDTNAKISEFVSFVSKNVANIFTTAISAFFSFVLMLLIMFYFLRDGERWRRSLVILSPLSDKDDEKIITKLRQAVNSVIKGNLLIAIIQGILMGFGLWIFGVPNGALWGIVASVCSLLPTFGTAIVSVPAIIFLFSTGQVAQGVGLLIWAALLVGLIDNFLSPFIIADKTKIPPLIILFAILGGLTVLGPVGILIGPLTISLLYTLISIYRNEFKQQVF